MTFWGVRIGSILAVIALCFGIQMLAGAAGTLATRHIMLIGLYITLAVSLNLINGITGQFSMGHAAFYMVGAYSSAAICALPAFSFVKSSPQVLIVTMMGVGIICSALAGLIVGLPSLRLKGDYLAVVTMGFGEIIRIVVQASPNLGLSAGMSVQNTVKSVFVVWLLACICIALCRNLLKNAHGLPFLAVREDEIASSAMGVNVTNVKVIGFVIGSAFAGAAGSLYAGFEGFIMPDNFKMDISFSILTMVVLGGTGSITGSALAAMALYTLPEMMRDLPPVSGAQLAGGAIALFLAVAAMKRVADHYHGPRGKKAGLIIGSIAAAVVLQFILAFALKNVGGLKDISFEAAKLRMALFAVTLVVMMLLRPQGILAHHEFSWDLIGRWLGLSKKPATRRSESS